jgi:hypothetical protein
MLVIHTRWGAETMYKLLFIFSTILFLTNNALASSAIGQIKNIEGNVQITNKAGSQRTAALGDFVSQNDIIETGKNSSVGITFVDDSRFSAGPDTILNLKRFSFNTTTHEGEFLTDMDHGVLSVISGKIAKKSQDAMKLELKTSILAVRGTYFAVKVD